MTSDRKRFAEWAQYAEEDLQMAKLGMKENGPPNQICFHSQQVAEKYIKGFLVYSDRQFKKVHQLRYLLELCAQIDSSFEKILRDDIMYLSRFYIETRYPGDFASFSADEAKRALTAAINVKDFVLSKIL